MIERFWERLACELQGFVEGSKKARDFVGRFELLVEELPYDSDPTLRTAFESFHGDVSYYNPNPELRREVIGLIGEDALRRKARIFLKLIEKTELNALD